MSIEDEIKGLKAKIAAKQNEKARAEVQLDTAKQGVKVASEKLKEEFGVTTPDEIATERLKLEQALSGAVSQVRTKLQEAGA